jgi:hypothetical protein
MRTVDGPGRGLSAARLAGFGRPSARTRRSSAWPSHSRRRRRMPRQARWSRPAQRAPGVVGKRLSATLRPAIAAVSSAGRVRVSVAPARADWFSPSSSPPSVRPRGAAPARARRRFATAAAWRPAARRSSGGQQQPHRLHAHDVTSAARSMQADLGLDRRPHCSHAVRAIRRQRSRRAGASVRVWLRAATKGAGARAEARSPSRPESCAPDRRRDARTRARADRVRGWQLDAERERRALRCAIVARARRVRRSRRRRRRARAAAARTWRARRRGRRVPCSGSSVTKKRPFTAGLPRASRAPMRRTARQRRCFHVARHSRRARRKPARRSAPSTSLLRRQQAGHDPVTRRGRARRAVAARQQPGEQVGGDDVG